MPFNDDDFTRDFNRTRNFIFTAAKVIFGLVILTVIAQIAFAVWLGFTVANTSPEDVGDVIGRAVRSYNDAQ